MKSVVVVEGPLDVLVLRPLIDAAKFVNIDVIPAGGKSSATSLGPSIAQSRGFPVAVVVDADTTDERSITEQKLVFADLQRFSTPDVRCRLFLAVPTVEDELFVDQKSFMTIYDLVLSQPDAEKFQKDRMSVIRKLTKSGASGIPHGKIDTAKAKRGLGIPLLAELFAFLRDPSK